MPWNVILEHDPETDAYTATVAGLDDIVVDASSEQEALTMAQEAIRFYLEEAKTNGIHVPTASPEARVVPVDI
jgi:predicted RNase H-like HicB family nuclease